MSENFSKLGIAANLIKKLEERGITDPTDIQKKIIPCLFAGESVFFSSATGTGKTFAYLLPLLSKLQEEISTNKPSQITGISPKILILAPTLELCSQISSELEFLLQSAPEADAANQIHSSLVIGSVNPNRQIESLRKNRPDIVVGNTGRILALAKKGILKLNLDVLILDEADRLVSDELTEELTELCKMIAHSGKKSPESLTIAACSATMNKKNREKILLAVFQSNKINIPFIESGANEIMRDKIEHWAIFSERRRKDQTLRSLLAAMKTKKKKMKALIFTSRSDEAGFILTRLQHHHINAAGLFGKISKKPLSSQERRAALDAFRQGNIDALVSTDLAARGLDIQGITLVIALDVPSDSEVYIHRCGRTARAGKRGIMVTIGDETQMRLLALLEKKLKIKIQPKELHYGEVCAPLPVENEE